MCDAGTKLRNRLRRASRKPTLRIARIEAWEFHRALGGTAWNPAGRWHERRAPLVRLVAEDGTVGIGEGWSDQGAIGHFFDHLAAAAPGLLHHGTTNLVAPATTPAWAGPAVWSALDMALWDLRARRAGQPLHAMLGAHGHAVPVYASGGLYRDGEGPAALAAEMRGYAARGFTAVKMKLGGLPLPEDVARVAAVHRALGPAATIITDAVEQLTPGNAPGWLDALAAGGVAAIQAPLPETDVAGLAALQARGPLPVIAGERTHDPAAFAALLDRRAVGLLQVNAGLAGGMGGVLALLAQARAAGVPVTLQCHGTAVLLAASLQLGAGRPGLHSVEMHQFHDHLYGWLPPAMTRVDAGTVRLDGTPGLGIDPAAFDRPLPGPGHLRRVWRLPD